MAGVDKSKGGKTIKKIQSKYFSFGDYPESIIYKKERKRIINEIIEVVIHRDLIERYKIRNTKLIRIRGKLALLYEEKKEKKIKIGQLTLPLKLANDIQRIVNHYFHTKGLTLEEIKISTKKKKIIYSRHVRAAKQLLGLAGSLKKAFLAIDKVAEWAKSRNLDYAIEVVFKKNGWN